MPRPEPLALACDAVLVEAGPSTCATGPICCGFPQPVGLDAGDCSVEAFGEGRARCACGCGASLTGLRAHAVYATEACRSRAARGRRVRELREWTRAWLARHPASGELDAIGIPTARQARAQHHALLAAGELVDPDELERL